MASSINHESYSDHDLLMNFLLLLGTLHSTSGVNAGRSTRSNLRESAFYYLNLLNPDFLEIPSFNENLVFWLAFARRQEITPETILFTPGTITVKAFPGRLIAAELLWYLKLWYYEDSKQAYPLRLEHDLAEIISFLFPLPYPKPFFDIDTLLIETTDRRSLIIHLQCPW